MHIKWPAKPISALDEAIDEATLELKSYEATTEEYQKIVNQLAALHAIRDSKKSDRISKDTLAIVLGNLLGIIVIVGYEQKHVIGSKALGFVNKFTK